MSAEKRVISEVLEREIKRLSEQLSTTRGEIGRLENQISSLKSDENKIINKMELINRHIYSLGGNEE